MSRFIAYLVMAGYTGFVMYVLIFDWNPFKKEEVTYNVGDCIMYDIYREEWETDEEQSIFRVKKVGEKKYLVEWVYPYYMNNELTDLSKYLHYKKVNCP